jgi:hypothetical protein
MILDSETLFKFIQEIGFRTQEEISEAHPKENSEIVNALTDYLISRNKIRKVKYLSPTGMAVLFYVVSNE